MGCDGVRTKGSCERSRSDTAHWRECSTWKIIKRVQGNIRWGGGGVHRNVSAPLRVAFDAGIGDTETKSGNDLRARCGGDGGGR